MESVTTYDELKDVISRAYPGMSKQLQRIARFALEQPHDMALGTVATVAEATEVQPSAMIRFANALGYGGFSEMQQVFRGHLLERSDTYRERIEQMRRKQVRGARAPSSVLHQLVTESVAELGHLEEKVSQLDMKAAVKLIAVAPRIHVLAQRRAFPVAGYLAYALSQLELKTHLLDGAGGMLRESLRSIAPGDVMIAASFRNYSPEVIEAAATASRCGASVIAITDGPLSPLKASARVCLELADDSSKPFRSLVAPLCLAQALVVSTGHHLAEQSADKPVRAAPRRKETR
ncbi:MAG: MurR/RpiR family transcriptional regulator [Polaromonas sp.]|uniref:MurR/RpiR family transcriptional regulator n=1 Tax=Polaromonas sp. TaxID=1869339 RepID=UPI002731C793|nr:MurR/RpiR family transcriptional regulator [Polaromonas sp.]MDP1741091.1 MurR/RpiR family transcriptional regulator [Polaromonas sp.]MDP1953124.1 MurR/RpiR family transcriptional regulator [Polaromonas sp.]MDP3356381.1 MurR/RpiR family transcriptional regulator [Polaromonas sp.]MDP3753123.1 MurR/RpiR family transcriptional regulator [Polaromonas sp.]